jgi:hypothetical protein
VPSFQLASSAGANAALLNNFMEELKVRVPVR